MTQTILRLFVDRDIRPAVKYPVFMHARRLLLTLFVALVFTASPANSEDGTKTISIPVLFATDRVEDKGKFGAKVRGEDGVVYGVRQFDVSIKNGASDPQRSKELTWVSKLTDTTKLDADQKSLTRDEFFKAINVVQESSEHKKLIVFLHGCCLSSKTSLRIAAELSVSHGVPVIAYDWATPSDYQGSESNAKLSQFRFNEFMEELENGIESGEHAELARRRIGAISLVGHSMGNRLIQDYLYVRYSAKKHKRDFPTFERVDLCNADTFSEEFIASLRYIKQMAGDISVYVNDKDKALFSALLLHRFSERRTGSPGESGKQLLASKGVTVVDHSTLPDPSSDLIEEIFCHSPVWWLTSNCYRYGTINDVKKYVLKQDAKSKHRFKVVPASSDAERQVVIVKTRIDGWDPERKDLGAIEKDQKYIIDVDGDAIAFCINDDKQEFNLKNGSHEWTAPDDGHLYGTIDERRTICHVRADDPEPDRKSKRSATITIKRFR